MRKFAPTRLALPALLAGIGLALAACGGPGEVMAPQQPAPAQTSVPAPAASDPAPPAASPSAEADAEEEPPADDAAAGSDELTKPGTELKLGEKAILHVKAGKKGDDYYKVGTWETAVTKIEEGDPADFEKFKNKDDFKGLVPFYIYASHEITSIDGPGNNLQPPTLKGMLAGGADAQVLISFGGFDKCKSEYLRKYEVGSKTTTCTIALAPTGAKVTGAKWLDGNWDYAKYNDNPYRESPVTWVS